MNPISKRHLFSLSCAALLALASTQIAYAAETPSFGSIIGDDFKHTVTAPSRWESNEWENLGWATLAVVGVSVIADAPVRDFMRRQTPGNSFLGTVENFGQPYAFDLMATYYLVGVISDDEKTIRVSQDLIAASMVTAGINQTIKTATSRSRPRDNQGTGDFQGYTQIQNNSSFPSGHATEAFTLAAVLSAHYEETWVSVTTYSIAGLVGVARMYHDAHFASDVTASALIGIFVGKSIVSHNSTLRGNSANKLVLLPEVTSDYAGMRIVGNF
jgi:hypothetical protein